MGGESGVVAALDRVDRPVFALDGDWRVTYANAATGRLLADGEDLTGEVFWDAVPGVTDTDLPETVHAAVAESEVGQTVVTLSDGRRVQFRAFPEDDGDGLTVLVEDVTDRYREVRRYEAVFEASVDPVCVVDAEGRFEDVNAAAEDVTGYDRERLVGARAGLVFEDYQRLQRHAADDESGDIEVTIETATGTERRCSVGAAPLAEGEGFVVVVRDLTGRRSREQRVAVLDRVLRHNIRNGMNVVMGRADAGLAVADDETAEHLQRIRETAEDLVHVSQDVRRFADAIDPDAGSATPRDAVALVRWAVDEVERRHPGADLRVVVREPVTVRSYQSVRAAVEELVENAVVHSDQETPTVTVTVDAAEDNGVVSVADRGPGLPETEQEVLTEGGETQLTHASGVGLWLVNWAVTKSGGTLGFEPNDPDGSVVTLRLPRVPDASEGAAPAPADGDGESASGAFGE